MTNVPDPSVKPLLTVDEAESLLGVSRSTVYRRINDGTLPSIRLGARSTRLATAEILRMLGFVATVDNKPEPKETSSEAEG